MDTFTLDNAPAAHVLEAAVVVLSERLGIEDPQQIRDELARFSAADGAGPSFEAVVREASEAAPGDVATLARLLLRADAGDGRDAGVAQALATAGHKQMAITPDMLWMVGGLVALCILRNPTLSTVTTMKIEEAPDGSQTITYKKVRTNVNPFSSIMPMLQKLSKFVAPGSGDTA
jgi:hypothetical protein